MNDVPPGAPQPVQEPVVATSTRTWVDAIGEHPEVRDRLFAWADRMAAFIERKMEGERHATGRAQIVMLIWITVLAGLVIIPVALLVNAGKVSPDSGTFVFGAVVGAAFTFLRDLFPSFRS